VIAVTGAPGSGRTTTVENLATALTSLGRQVLVIDECGGGRSFTLSGGRLAHVGHAGPMSQMERFDAALRGQLPLAEAIDTHACGFGVLAAPHSDDARYAGEPLAKRLADVADIVLIDARLDRDGALSPLALNAREVLLVTRTDAQAITVSYACIKRLHFAHAIAQFRVVANGVQHEADARVLDNLVSVASRYLAVALERAGCIAADPHMPRAVELARPIVDAFPSTAAARDFRRVAAELLDWPLRPALASLAASRAGSLSEEAAAASHGYPDGNPSGNPDDDSHANPHHDPSAPAAHLTNVPAVTTVASIVEAAPAHAGWQSGPSAPRHRTHHA
jgi:flagellar biosynthesis protein FlhG